MDWPHGPLEKGSICFPMDFYDLGLLTYSLDFAVKYTNKSHNIY